MVIIRRGRREQSVVSVLREIRDRLPLPPEPFSPPFDEKLEGKPVHNMDGTGDSYVLADRGEEARNAYNS